jgi:hypothetical protein
MTILNLVMGVILPPPHSLSLRYDAINGLPAVQPSVTFEKACIIFNMAALHSQIAAQVV